MNTFDDYKQFASDFLERYFGVQTSRNFKCINPMHNDDNPSMSFDKTNFRAHCFGCDQSYDIFDLVGLYFGIEDKGEQFKKVQDLYGGGAKAVPPKKQKQVKTEPKTEEIRKYLERCKSNIFKTEYFQSRGLSNETIERCNLGYDDKEDAVVIPYSKAMDYYQRRSIKEKRFYKPPTEYAGQEPLYNAQALRLKTRKPIFIVESPICAISIIQCGGQAVALCGTSGGNKLITLVKAKKPLGTLVLCFDNDEPGQDASRKYASKLKELDVKFLICNIAGECKDPNELLVKDAPRLQRNIENAIIEARKLTATKYDSIPLEELMQKKFAPRTWLVDGLIPRGLTLLASPTKVGKSWMMLQLAQAIAEGKDFLGFKTHKSEVDYLALEDDEERIVGRTKRQRKGEPIQHGCHITLRAPTLDNDRLLDVLAEKLEENSKLKLFIIDTLQKVRKASGVKENANAYASDYVELSSLKEFADDNDIAIICVHHTRKMIDEIDPFANILGSVGLQGVVDTMIVINNRKQEQILMYYKGRDIENSSKVIELDNDTKGGTFLWSIVGTPEEQEIAREKREYDNNPLVITIKELLKHNSSGWSGTATQITNAIYDVTKQVTVITATQIGKELQKIATKLHRDGIDFTSKRTGEKRTITFTYNRTPSWLKSVPTYQPKFYED